VAAATMRIHQPWSTCNRGKGVVAAANPPSSVFVVGFENSNKRMLASGAIKRVKSFFYFFLSFKIFNL
jgi:hypothetical protein